MASAEAGPEGLLQQHGIVDIVDRVYWHSQALRGKLWQSFLNTDSKREAGAYDALVQKALGGTKYGRRVRTPPPLALVCVTHSQS